MLDHVDHFQTVVFGGRIGHCRVLATVLFNFVVIAVSFQIDDFLVFVFHESILFESTQVVLLSRAEMSYLE